MLLEHLNIDDLKEEQAEVAELIGLSNYKKLISYYAGTSIYIPKLNDIERRQRNEKIRSEYEKNNDLKSLAIKFGLTEVQIRTIVMDIFKAKKDCLDDGQISIFDDI